MKFVIQRVSGANVTVAGNIIGEISHGFVVFIGVSDVDTTETADRLIKKLINLRIFEDENHKANLSLSDVEGELLLISQFTLYANCKKGNRPSFIEAGSPDLANSLYEYIVQECRNHVAKVATGQFGAMMKVNLTNEGPFTIILDSNTL